MNKLTLNLLAKKLLAPAAFGMALCVAACGGGDDEAAGNGICKAVAQSSGTVSSTTQTGSTITNAPAAFDGNFGTFATLTPSAAGGGGTIRGTNGSGLSGSQVVGVATSLIKTSGTVSVSITTYNNGVMADTGSAGTQMGTSQACPGTCESRDGVSFYGISTTMPFNAIEASVTVAGSSTPIQIRELCTK